MPSTPMLTLADVQQAYLLVNSAINYTHCLYLHYNQNQNKLTLRWRRTNWTALCAWSSAIIENSYGALNCTRQKFLTPEITWLFNEHPFKTASAEQKYIPDINDDSMPTPDGQRREGLYVRIPIRRRNEMKKRIFRGISLFLVVTHLVAITFRDLSYARRPRKAVNTKLLIQKRKILTLKSFGRKTGSYKRSY